MLCSHQNTGNFRFNQTTTVCPSPNVVLANKSLNIIKSEPSYGEIGFSWGQGPLGKFLFTGPPLFDQENKKEEGFTIIKGEDIVPMYANVLKDFKYEGGSGRLIYIGDETKSFRIVGSFRISNSIPFPAAMIYKNGAGIGSYMLASQGATVTVETITTLSTNDYVELAGSLFVSGSTESITNYQLMIHSL